MTTIGFRNAGRWAAAKREFCNQIQFQRFVFLFSQGPHIFPDAKLTKDGAFHFLVNCLVESANSNFTK